MSLDYYASQPTDGVAKLENDQIIRANLALQVKLVKDNQGSGRLMQPLLPGLLMAEMYIRSISCTTFF